MISQRLQSKKVLTGVGIATVGIILGLSNPNQNAYSKHLAKETSLNLKENICSEAPEALGGFIKAQCNNLASRGEPQIKRMINASTQRNNFLIFSLYETEMSIVRGTPSFEAEAIGFLGNVWVYRSEVVPPEN